MIAAILPPTANRRVGSSTVERLTRAIHSQAQDRPIVCAKRVYWLNIKRRTPVQHTKNLAVQKRFELILVSRRTFSLEQFFAGSTVLVCGLRKPRSTRDQQDETL